MLRSESKSAQALTSHIELSWPLESVLMEQNAANPQTSVRSPSLRSHTSIASSMSNLFHRRKRESIAHVLGDHDKGSIISSSSQGRPKIPSSRTIKRQASNSSITTTRSNHIPHDLRSISSKRSLKSSTTASDFDGPPRNTARSLRGEPPPSAFHASHRTPPPPIWSTESGTSRSAAEIRSEILQTELEERTVLSTLGVSNHPLTHNRTSSELPHSVATKRRSKLSSHDISMDTVVLSRPLRDNIATLNTTRHMASPGMSLPRQNVSGLDSDMVDLHYRQVEIAERYKQRLDYLRARLKGAELHERLIRK